jgi:EmrB/QacA subfamily drug resistance transporter
MQSSSSLPAQIWVIGLGTAVAPLDTSVNIAFPDISRGLDLAVGDIQWVVISYVLTYAALMLTLGRAGDLFGHALVFRAGLAWSIVALALCATARTLPTLLVCRILQGVGASLVLSCGPALITSLRSEEQRGRMLGLYVMMMSIAGALGPLLGGMLVAAWGWPAVFWFRVPIAAAALLCLRGKPIAKPAVQGSFDFVGAALLTGTLLAMLLALNRARELAAVPLGLIAMAALAAFVRHEARSRAPILDPRLFGRPGFALINLANVLINLAAFAVWLLVPFYLARITDLTPAAGGLVLGTAPAGAIVASPLAGRLAGRVRSQNLMLAGAALVAVGLALIATWDAGTVALWLIVPLSLQGFGIGLFQLAATDLVTGTIAPEHRGVAGSLVLVTRTVGTVAAASVVTLAFQSLEVSAGFLAAFRATFVGAAALAFAMAALLAIGWTQGRDNDG